MKTSRLFLGLALLFGVGVSSLTSCGETGTSTSSTPIISIPDDPNALLETPVTDALEFPYESDYKDKDFFAENATGVIYGQVKLVSCTDGDTANFRRMNDSVLVPAFKTRFLGINTPESTAQVEPWGVKASRFTYEKLTTAEDICLVNDVLSGPADTSGYERTDTAGNRYLTFVWYKEPVNHTWRLLNLELVEQCYSRNQLFNDSELGYMPSFIEASDNAVSTRMRVNGTQDPDYDYSDQVVEASLWYVRENYDSLGIDKDDGSSGKQLRVTGLVVGMIGDNMVIKDIVTNPDAEGWVDPYQSMYCFVGYNTGLASKVQIGDVVCFYCRASKFPADSENIQLTDVVTSSFGNQRFETLARLGDENWSDYVPSDCTIDPVVVENITDEPSLGVYSGYYTQVDITVRITEIGEYDDNGNWVSSGHESYFNDGASGTTIYAYVAGTRTVCNLRIDDTCYPLLTQNDFEPEKSYRVKAYLTPYFDNYQLQIFSNLRGYDYVTPLD